MSKSARRRQYPGSVPVSSVTTNVSPIVEVGIGEGRLVHEHDLVPSFTFELEQVLEDREQPDLIELRSDLLSELPFHGVVAPFTELDPASEGTIEREVARLVARFHHEDLVIAPDDADRDRPDHEGRNPPGRAPRGRRPSTSGARMRSACCAIRAAGPRRSAGPARAAADRASTRCRSRDTRRDGCPARSTRGTGRPACRAPSAPSSWMKEPPAANNTSSTPWSTTRSRRIGFTPSVRR